MTDRLLLADGTTQVLDALRRSLAGAGATAPLPTDPHERSRTLAMLRPELPVEEAGAAAVVATSGSTGRPRGVVLTAEALVASAEATHRRLSGPGRWVLALPAHYVAGLMVLVRSLVAEQPPIEVDPRLDTLPSLAPADGEPTYLSVVPTQLTRALTDPAKTAALRRCDAVLLGGAAADPALLTRARDAGIAVVTTYGMSETCGGCVYDGLPLDLVDVTADVGGRLVIGGPTVFAGYRLDPTATADALVDGRLVTRDRGRVASDGRVEVLGRVDDVVISGGLNVDLAVVERAVRGWAGDESAVVGVPHPDWGVEVVAVIARDERAAPASVPPDPRPSSVISGRAIAGRSPRRPRGGPAGLRAPPPAGGPRGPAPYLRWQDRPSTADRRPDRTGRPPGGPHVSTDLTQPRRPTAAQWAAGARPRTLPAAIAPVLAGSGVAAWAGGFSLGAALLALLVSLALQIGVNYANDYSDGVRGTDAVRVGPLRLVGSGVAEPGAVKRAAFVCFGVAAAAGLVLVLLTGFWWLLAVGAACVLAAWYYTGGKRRTATAGSARSSSSSSSVWWRSPARCWCRWARCRGRPGRWPSASARSPARSWWPTTCATCAATWPWASTPWPPGSVIGAPAGSTSPWSPSPPWRWSWSRWPPLWRRCSGWSGSPCWSPPSAGSWPAPRAPT